jgi:hypothetical protein
MKLMGEINIKMTSVVEVGVPEGLPEGTNLSASLVPVSLTFFGYKDLELIPKRKEVLDIGPPLSGNDFSNEGII